jgi:hypothetical protein
MRTWLRRALSAAAFIVIAGCYIAPLVMLAGCAVGRNDTTGEVVLGVAAGKLVESTNQALGALTDTALTALGVGIPGAGGLVALAVRGFTKAGAEKRIRESADAAYEEGRAAALSAKGNPNG